MPEFIPISTLADLSLQHEGDMQMGYSAGRRGDGEPGSWASRAYWHGWRNGRVDGGHAEPDAPQRLLAHAFVAAYGEDCPPPIV